MLYLMSTTVIPAEAEGIWRITSLGLEDAVQLVHDEMNCVPGGGPAYTSAVGHESTAEAMAELLAPAPVAANRITVRPRPGDQFLCFRLNRRPPEGAILNRAQLEELGYGWALMEYLV